jgi:hypothetical protein
MKEDGIVPGKTQSSQVRKPLMQRRPLSNTAKFLPTTAMLPLSKYRKGRLVSRPLRSFEISRPTYRPCWIATCATPGSGRVSSGAKVA